MPLSFSLSLPLCVFLDLSPLFLHVFLLDSLCLILSMCLFGTHPLSWFPLHICSLPLSLPSLVYLLCVFPLAVKDLDTEKYFHLVSARPLALGLPPLTGCGRGFLPPWSSGENAPRLWERLGGGERRWESRISREPGHWCRPSASGRRMGPPLGRRRVAPGPGTDRRAGLPGAAHRRAGRAQEVPPAEPPQEGATRDLPDPPAVYQGRPGLRSLPWKASCPHAWGARALPPWSQLGSQGERLRVLPLLRAPKGV